MTELLDGPWESAFCVELPAKLRSKSNYRKGQKGWAALATFEAVAGATFAQAKPEAWDIGDKSKPLKDRPTAVLVVAATSLVDSTNFTKSVADAMEGVLVVNDASVTASATLAQRAKKEQRCMVALAQLPPRATMQEQSEALQELVRRMPELFEGEG